jgi:hypothetical protein
VIGAFAYLILTTTRNKLLSQVKRLRNPRYAIAILLGLAYFWFAFFNPGARGSRAGGGSPFRTEVVDGLAAIFIFLYVAYTWIVGADRYALAFSEAEVSMLFTAPVSRRGLIIYKLVRAQAAVLTTSILWLFLFRRGGSGIEKFLSSWVFLTTMNLHRLGVALIRVSQSEHGVQGIRRNWLPISVFAGAGATVVWALFSARALLMGASHPSELGPIIVDLFSRPPLNWVLYPFRVAMSPAFATSADAWLRAMFAAVVLLALHVWWVLRTDTAFEEAAALASAAQAKRIAALRSRSSRSGVVDVKRPRRTLKLNPTGVPAIAIVWKNFLWLTRTGQIRGLVGLPAIALVCALVFAGRSDTVEELVVIMCGVMTVMILIFGPATMRNDLRGELSRLPMLKTMPLRGRDIMLAEVASSASPTAAMQLLLVAVALLATSFNSRDTLPVGIRIAILVAAPVLLFGLSAANFTIHNGMALLFPAWVRLGDTGGGGVESIGQMLLTSIVTISLLALLLIVPVLVGSASYFMLQSFPPIGVAGAGIVAGLLLGLESWLVIAMLGGTLERLEPTEIG